VKGKLGVVGQGDLLASEVGVGRRKRRTFRFGRAV